MLPLLKATKRGSQQTTSKLICTNPLPPCLQPSFLLAKSFATLSLMPLSLHLKISPTNQLISISEISPSQSRFFSTTATTKITPEAASIPKTIATSTDTTPNANINANTATVATRARNLRKKPLKAYRHIRNLLKMLNSKHLSRPSSIFKFRLVLRKSLQFLYGGLSYQKYFRTYPRSPTPDPQYMYLFQTQLNVLLLRMQYVPNIFMANHIIRSGHILVNGSILCDPFRKIQVGDLVQCSVQFRYHIKERMFSGYNFDDRHRRNALFQVSKKQKNYVLSRSDSQLLDPTAAASIIQQLPPSNEVKKSQ